MSELRWRAFFICNSVTQPFVHFFPHSTGATAPYPVLATISIFGTGVKAASVTLEGARLSQPDGVRLDAIFEDLANGVQGLVGLEVALHPRQRRMDLSASQVVVELIQGRSSTRYFAAPVTDTSVAGSVAVPACANDSLQPTVVAINGSDQTATAAIAGVGAGQEVTVAPRSVKELGMTSMPVEQHSVDGNETGVSSPMSQRFLQANAAPVSEDCSIVSSSNDEGLSFFALYRDTQSKAPVSVMAL